MYKRKPDVDEEVIPFSVADMELPTPPEIVDGLCGYLRETVLGYSGPYEAYYQSVEKWLAERHGWNVERDWLVETNGVVPALFAAVNAFSKPGDGVILLTPVYYPFYAAATANNREVVGVPLLQDADRRYVIDFDRLAEEAAKEQNRILLFCNPHNPVGRSWSGEELERVAAICLESDVFVVSDEIHFDLVMPGHRHIPFASLGTDAAANCLVAFAPSKTFNLAGIQASNIAIPDRAARTLFVRERRKAGLMSNNIFAYKATEIAYARCGAWLDAFLVHVAQNYRVLRGFMREFFPEIFVHDLEGTYLAWLDFRAWGMGGEELERFMIEKCQLFFDEGLVFGKEGEGFERINLACPRRKLEEALGRLAAARGR